MTPVCEPVQRTASGTGISWFSSRAQIATGICVCAAGSAFIYAVDPNHHSVYPQCLLYKITGIYCVGCGATRAVYALLHGRILDALHDNALLIGALPFLLFMFGPYLIKAWQINVWPKVTLEERSVKQKCLGIALLMFSFMLLRNLPGWPFDWLKPLVG